MASASVSSFLHALHPWAAWAALGLVPWSSPRRRREASSARRSRSSSSESPRRALHSRIAGALAPLGQQRSCPTLMQAVACKAAVTCKAIDTSLGVRRIFSAHLTSRAVMYSQCWVLGKGFRARTLGYGPGLPHGQPEPRERRSPGFYRARHHRAAPGMESSKASYEK